MQHNVKFLEAVHAFVTGGKASELNAAMEALAPSGEDKAWVLNIYRDALKEPTSASCEPFVEELVRLLNLAELASKQQNSITPAVIDTEIYKAMFEAGWMPLGYLMNSTSGGTNKLRGHRSTVFSEVEALAKEVGLSNDICRFQRKTETFTMLSPKLAVLCKERLASQELLPMQPGERIKSVFNVGMFKLLDALVGEMQRHGMPVEAALVKRRVKRGARDPQCLTVELQEVLQAMDLIQLRDVNKLANMAVGAGKRPIVLSDPKQLAALASEVYANLNWHLLNAEAEPALAEDGPEKFIARHEGPRRGGSR